MAAAGAAAAVAVNGVNSAEAVAANVALVSAAAAAANVALVSAEAVALMAAAAVAVNGAVSGWVCSRQVHRLDCRVVGADWWPMAAVTVAAWSRLLLEWGRSNNRVMF